MPTLERTITVDTPLDAVWAFLTDFTTTERWDPPTVSTELASGSGGVGSVYRNVSKILGREVEIDHPLGIRGVEAGNGIRHVASHQLRGSDCEYGGDLSDD